jgi:hypothetical protein
MTTLTPGPLVGGLGRIRTAVIGAIGAVVAALAPALADNVITLSEARSLGILTAGVLVVWIVPTLTGVWSTALKALALAAAGVLSALTEQVYGNGIQSGELVTLLIVALTAAGILAVDDDPPPADLTNRAYPTR